mmetsp:Transcript_24619/g.56826  ORF Transcript_24619/g.56826 Transcript_24619/m.56826 type:complete len:214 (-) Transcript_24619:1420-2061(-)
MLSWIDCSLDSTHCGAEAAGPAVSLVSLREPCRVATNPSTSSFHSACLLRSSPTTVLLSSMLSCKSCSNLAESWLCTWSLDSTAAVLNKAMFLSISSLASACCFFISAHTPPCSFIPSCKRCRVVSTLEGTVDPCLSACSFHSTKAVLNDVTPRSISSFASACCFLSSMPVDLCSLIASCTRCSVASMLEMVEPRFSACSFQSTNAAFRDATP